MNVNLYTIDDFSEESYKQLLLTKKHLGATRSTKTACIHSLVSQNRLRFNDQEFNLDLAYISTRVIAMGFPAMGIRSIYRNPLNQVLEFFKKHHENKVKVYNLCDDSFIDMNQLNFSQNGEIRAAFFPMADHNPGPVNLLF